MPSISGYHHVRKPSFRDEISAICPLTMITTLAIIMITVYMMIQTYVHHRTLFFYLFPNSGSLGSSAIVKGPEQVGATKICRFPGSREGFCRFQVPRFQGTGSQVPETKDPVPRDPCSQEQVFKQGSLASFPGNVLHARLPGIPRNRVPS